VRCVRVLMSTDVHGLLKGMHLHTQARAGGIRRYAYSRITYSSLVANLATSVDRGSQRPWYKLVPPPLQAPPPIAFKTSDRGVLA